MDGLTITLNYFYDTAKSRNPYSSKQLPYLFLMILLSILKAGGEEMAGLLTVKGRMVRIAGFYLVAESHIIEVVSCRYKKNKKYLQD